MHKLQSLILISVLAMGIWAAEDSSTQTLLDNLKYRHAPDKRTSVYALEYVQRGDTLVITGETDKSEVLEDLKSQLKKQKKPWRIDAALLPHPSLGDSCYGIIKLSTVTIHGVPDITTELVNQTIMGTAVKILKDSAGYFRIQTPDQYLGWVEKGTLVRITKNQYNHYDQSGLAIYMDRWGLIYEKPDAGSQPCCDIVMTALVKPLEEKGEWVRIQLPDGQEGYVIAKSLKDYQQWKTQTVAAVDNIIQTARQFMGVPYLWGGASSKMLDCSGFVQLAFKINNYLLPRDASQQVFLGEEIEITDDFRNARPGDLLFFGHYDKQRQRERITHVGLYLGDYRYIHEATSVHINSLHPDSVDYNEYRHSHLRHIKRILGAEPTKK